MMQAFCESPGLSTTLKAFGRVLFDQQFRTHSLLGLVARKAEYNCVGEYLTWRPRIRRRSIASGKEHCYTNVRIKQQWPWRHWLEPWQVEQQLVLPEELWRQLEAKFRAACEKLTKQFLQDLVSGESGFSALETRFGKLELNNRPRMVSLKHGRIEYTAYATSSVLEFLQNVSEDGTDTCVLGSKLKEHVKSTRVGNEFAHLGDWSGSSIYGLHFIDCSSEGMEKSYLFPRKEFMFRFLSDHGFDHEMKFDVGKRCCAGQVALWGSWFPVTPSAFTAIV